MFNTFRFKADCVFCSETNVSPEATREQFIQYENGSLVQDVWPDWSEDEREIVCGNRTGVFICPTCWDGQFAEA